MSKSGQDLIDHKFPDQIRFWRENKKIVLGKKNSSVVITNAQNSSTPGIMTDILVRPGTRYRVSVDGMATGRSTIYVGDQVGRIGPTVFLNPTRGWTCVEFNSLDCTKIRLGILFGPQTKKGNVIEVHQIKVKQISSEEYFFDGMPIKGSLTERGVHQYLQKTLADREIRKYEQFVNDIKCARFKIIHVYHQMALARYKGLVSGRYKKVYNIIEGLPKDHFIRNQLRLLAIDETIRANDINELVRLVKIDATNSIDRLPVVTIIGIAKLLIKEGLLDQCRMLLEKARGYLGIIDRFKILEIEVELKKRVGSWNPIVDPTFGWQDVLNEFQNYRIKEHGDLLLKEEKEAYSMLESIPESVSSFLNVRFSERERVKLLGRIQGALRSKESLSLMRLGDGEAYAMGVPEESRFRKMFEEDNCMRERTWWGKELSPEKRSKLQFNIRQAMLNANILGIPSIYRLIRDMPYEPREFFDLTVNRGLWQVLRFATMDMKNGAIFTEDRCHQILFTRDNLLRLSADADSVVWVSCWDSSRLNLGNSISQQWIEVPGHTRVKPVSGDSTIESLCDNYESILTESLNCFAPGALVLVSAGILGKVFIDEAARRGAVALDIGAMSDYFVGIKTRSIGEII